MHHLICHGLRPVDWRVKKTNSLVALGSFCFISNGFKKKMILFNESSAAVSKTLFVCGTIIHLDSSSCAEL